MTGRRLFHVIFEGRPLEDVENSDAVEALAGLLKKEPGRVAGLFNGRPRIMKRSVPEETAVLYLKALQDAGLAAARDLAGAQLRSKGNGYPGGPEREYGYRRPEQPGHADPPA